MADYIDSFDVNGTEYDLRDKGAVRTTGGTMTGNLNGQHLIGTWLRTTDVTALGSAAARFAVLDGSGWVYYRTKDQLLSDLGLTGVTKITVDSEMSASSTNPVQNKVVKAALDGKASSSHSHAGYAEAKVFRSVSVPANAWENNASAAIEGYPYSAYVELQGVTGNHFAEVVFSAEDATSGNFAPISGTGTNLVVIWAKQAPTAAIQIQTIFCTKVV